MAVVKMGAIVTDIKGKLGGHVFQGTLGGSTMRTKFKGGKSLADTVKRAGDPIPGIDITVNQLFAGVSANWKNTSPEEKASWDALKKSWTFTNKFGDVVQRSGNAIYTAANINRRLAGLSILSNAPVEQPTYPLNMKLIFDDVQKLFEMQVLNPETIGQYLVIEQAPIVFKNKLAPAQKYRIIKVMEIVDTDVFDVEPFLKIPPGFDIYTKEFAMFFRFWTFNPAYPRKMGIEKSDIRRGM